MNKVLLSVTAAVFFGMGINQIDAQYYSRAPISNGFNADVIANGTGAASAVTNNDVDGVSYAFVAQNYLQTATSTAITYGLPTSGFFTTAVATTPNLSYEFASYSANNSLRLSAINDSGTLTLTTPVAAFNLYILATSGSGTSTVNAQINFSDGSSQTATALALSDWYGGSNYALQGIGRIKITDSTLENGGGTNPRLYQVPVTIDAANVSKLIQSVTFTKASGSGLPNIFALSVNKYTACPAPTAITIPAATITSNSALVSWTAPTPAPSNGYQVYYSTSNTPPTDLTPANITNITSTSTTIPSLTANTNYYVWVRSVCGGTPGPYGFSGTFATACNSTTVPYTLDFENATVPAAPNCTSIINAGSGNNWITYNNPGAGFSTNVLRYNYNSSNAANSWFFTQGLQLTGGTQYTIQFDYGDNAIDSYSENLKVAYGTSSTVAAMTNVITDITGINTGALTHGSFSFTPAATGLYYFGFNVHSAADQYYLYVDNINIYNSNLATAETAVQAKEVKVYPNPFHDILNISDIKNLETATVTDLNGRTVKTFVKPSNELHLSELSAGNYLVALKYSDGTSKVIKVIKK